MRLERGCSPKDADQLAVECPVGGIRLVFGTSERGVDLPEVDASFESSRRGVHVVGELGGMGLIRNAIRQGLDVADALKARLVSGHASEGDADRVDVAIVGAGPAGLSTALGCRAHARHRHRRARMGTSRSTRTASPSARARSSWRPGVAARRASWAYRAKTSRRRPDGRLLNARRSANGALVFRVQRLHRSGSEGTDAAG